MRSRKSKSRIGLLLPFYNMRLQEHFSSNWLNFEQIYTLKATKVTRMTRIIFACLWITFVLTRSCSRCDSQRESPLVNFLSVCFQKVSWGDTPREVSAAPGEAE